MLNIKRKILVTRWVRDDNDLISVITYGKVNPVKWIQKGYHIESQSIIEFKLTEEQFAEAATYILTEGELDHVICSEI